jgi:hypothetical protein
MYLSYLEYINMKITMKKPNSYPRKWYIRVWDNKVQNHLVFFLQVIWSDQIWERSNDNVQKPIVNVWTPNWISDPYKKNETS